MDSRFASIARTAKAKWWQLQFRGVLAFHAAFIGCGQLVMRKLEPLGNAGVRKVMGWSRHYNVSSELRRARDTLNVCVQSSYCKSLVAYVGHCFRHVAHPVAKLLSLDFPSRLASLRQQNSSVAPSGYAQAHHSLLEFLGLQTGDLVTGRLNVRGHAGCRTSF